MNSGKCELCGDKGPTIMSMFNTDEICLTCKSAEMERPDYGEAVAKDLEEYAGRMHTYGCRPEQVDSVLVMATAYREGKV